MAYLLDGNNTLAQQQSQLQLQEKLSHAKTSSFAADTTAASVQNLADFKTKVSPGVTIPPLRLILSPAPAGTTVDFTTSVFVGGAITSVDVCR